MFLKPQEKNPKKHRGNISLQNIHRNIHFGNLTLYAGTNELYTTFFSLAIIFIHYLLCVIRRSLHNTHVSKRGI